MYVISSHVRLDVSRVATVVGSKAFWKIEFDAELGIDVRLCFSVSHTQL